MFGKIYSANRHGVLPTEAHARAAQTADYLSKLEIPDLDMLKVVGDKDTSLDTGVPIGNLISGRISHLSQFRDGKPFYWQNNLYGETRNISEFRAMRHGPFLIDSFTVADSVFDTRTKLVYTLLLDGRLRDGVDMKGFSEQLAKFRAESKKEDGEVYKAFKELASLTLSMGDDHKEGDLAEVFKKVGDILAFDSD